MAIPGAHIRAGRGSEPVGRQGPETSPKCCNMYGPCWATAISKLMFPKKYAWYPPLKRTFLLEVRSIASLQICRIDQNWNLEIPTVLKRHIVEVRYLTASSSARKIRQLCNKQIKTFLFENDPLNFSMSRKR